MHPVLSFPVSIAEHFAHGVFCEGLGIGLPAEGFTLSALTQAPTLSALTPFPIPPPRFPLAITFDFQLLTLRPSRFWVSTSHHSQITNPLP